MIDTIEIYSDGSAQPNPGKGGYGVVMIYKQHRKEISQGFIKSTNNRMELLGAIIALETIKIFDKKVTLTTDSKYVSDAFNKGWIYTWEKNNYKGRKNADLWRRMYKIAEKIKPEFIWVKGHNNHIENERCDVLAVQATQSNNLITDDGYLKN